MNLGDNPLMASLVALGTAWGGWLTKGHISHKEKIAKTETDIEHVKKQVDRIADHLLDGK